MKKIFLFVMMTFLLTPSLALAEADVGWAFLAATHRKFPAKTMSALAASYDRPYVSSLWETFGTNRKPMKKFILQSGSKPHTIQWYLANETCRRWNGCASYEFMPKLTIGQFNKAASKKKSKLIKRFKKKATEILRWCNANGSATTRCLITPGLEDNYNEKAARRLIKALKEVGWKDKQIVRNSCCGAYPGRAGAHYNEWHSLRISTAKPAIYSLDGFNPLFGKSCTGKTSTISGNKLSDSQVRQWTRDCKARANYCAAWLPQNQGLVTNSTGVGHPRSRRIHSGPRCVSRFKMITEGSSGGGGGTGPDKPHYTKKCSKVIDFGGGDLAKASDHGGTLVLVTKKKYRKIVAVTPDGKKEKLRYTGTGNPFNGKNRHHYRGKKAWASYPNNMIFRARKGLTKNICYRTFDSGQRHG